MIVITNVPTLPTITTFVELFNLSIRNPPTGPATKFIPLLKVFVSKAARAIETPKQSVRYAFKYGTVERIRK